MEPARQATAFRQLLTVLGGASLLEALSTIVELGVPDLLDDAPRDGTEIARAAGAVPERLVRILRALVTVDVVAEPEPGRFAATPITALLREGETNSLREYVRMRCAQFMVQPARAIREGVTGEAAPFDLVFGQPYFPWLRAHPDEARLFDAGMTSTAWMFGPPVLAAIDLADGETVMDVGGGQGRMLAGLLRRHPAARGILLDQPQVVAGAEPVLREAGVADRCSTVGGDFFAELPKGADAIVLSRILHDWGDADCARILRSCRAALADGGRLHVVEFVLAPGPEGAIAALFDLHMLQLFGHARERTEAEYAALFEDAGFRLDRVSRPDAAPNVVRAVAI